MSASPPDTPPAVLPQTVSDIETWLQAERLPPVHAWDPPDRGHSGMRIDADGRWYHNGDEIRRERLVALFSSILKREGERTYLVTPVEKLQIDIEDAPFQAVEITIEGSGEDQVLAFRLKTGGYVVVGDEHPVFLSGEDGDRPYVHVRAGLDARISRPAWYALADLVTEGSDGPGIWSSGAFFPLGTAD